MPKYLVMASYTSEGAKGLLKDGGTKRRQSVETSLKSIGGRVESFYYAFGDSDAVLIIDAPDNMSVAAAAMAINASGAVHIKTTVLLTLEEIDQAAKAIATYIAPGR